MGAYLRTLNSFQVRADTTTDDILDDGQTIQFSSKVDLVAARPNRMRIEVIDDDGHRFFFFDGKNFTIYGQVVHFYATVPAPPTIAQLADDLNDWQSDSGSLGCSYCRRACVSLHRGL
jgi:hypothetical protein